MYIIVISVITEINVYNIIYFKHNILISCESVLCLLCVTQWYLKKIADWKIKILFITMPIYEKSSNNKFEIVM